MGEWRTDHLPCHRLLPIDVLLLMDVLFLLLVAFARPPCILASG
jgi:hypothetical protein